MRSCWKTTAPLNDLAHKLDPTRPTTMANVFMLEITSPILKSPM